jgi:hypothetical protein
MICDTCKQIGGHFRGPCFFHDRLTTREKSRQPGHNHYLGPLQSGAQTKDALPIEMMLFGKQPILNLQIAKAYIAGTDSGINTRTCSLSSISIAISELNPKMGNFNKLCLTLLGA